MSGSYPARAWTLCCILLAACGGGSSSSTPSSPPPKAFRWDVALATAGPSCVKPNTPLRLSVSVYDKSGAPLANPSYQVASDVLGALEADGSGGYTVRGEGSVRITATYAGPVESNATIAPVAFDLVRDGTAPQIAGLQPARGAMLVSAGDIRVQGQVTDAYSPVQSVTVNGAEQLASAAGLAYGIDTTPAGRWGLNVVEITATDSCGNSAYQVQSYLRGEQFRPAATSANPAARVPKGQFLKLTQEAVDDQDRADLDDAATLVERFLQRNLSTLLQQSTRNAVVTTGSSCPGLNYTVTIPSPGASVVQPRVRSLTLQAGNMRQDVSIDTVTVPLRITAEVVGLLCNTAPPITVNATFSAAVRSISTTAISVDGNGKLAVTMPSPTVTVTQVQVSATGVAVIDNLISSVLGTISGVVGDAIGSQIRNVVPLVLAQFLNTPLTAGATIANGAFDLTLNAVAGMDGITIQPAAMTQSAFTQVYPSAAGTPFPAQGAIMRQTSAPDLASSPGPLTYAVDDNLINQGLWTLWYGGAMEIPDLAGLPGVKLRISGQLPPVLMPGAQAGEAAFGLGALKATLDLNLGDPNTIPPLTGAVHVEANVSLLLEGSIRYDGIAGQLLLDHQPGSGTSYVQFESVTDGVNPITDAAALDAVKQYTRELMSRLAEQLADGTLVSAMLPPLHLAFAQPVAGGTIDALAIDIKAVTRTADHVVFDMALRAEEPPNSQLDGFLTVNHPWTRDDLIAAGVANRLLDDLSYRDEPAHNAAASPTITVADYRHTTRPQCEAAGTSNGKPICLTNYKFPLAYGWYCGGGRPLVGFLANPALDPVDYCCRLHDQNLFAPTLAALSPKNACGFAMCLRMATASPADITQRLPDVEHARQQMYNKAALLCSGMQPALPPPEIVP